MLQNDLNTFCENLERLHASAESTAEREMEFYKTETEQLRTYSPLTQDTACSQEREAIEQLKKELEMAQTTRQNRIQYDEIARKIIGYPKREEMEETLARLQEEVSALRDENASYEEIEKGSCNGLQTIIHHLEQLNQTIETVVRDNNNSSEPENKDSTEKKSTLNPQVPSFTPQTLQDQSGGTIKRTHFQSSDPQSTSTQEQPESKRLRSKGNSNM